MPRNNSVNNSGSSVVNSPADPSSPYFVHPSENPSSALVNPPLNGNNYHKWARLMKKALISKNKFKFVDGSITVPDHFDPSYDAWEQCNNMIHSWILNSVSPSIANSIMFLENASDAWRDLRERFAQGD